MDAPSVTVPEGKFDRVRRTVGLFAGPAQQVEKDGQPFLAVLRQLPGAGHPAGAGRVRS